MRVAEQEENLVLNLLELFLHLGIADNELILHLCEIRALLGDHDAQQLVLQALRGDQKVENGNLYTDLRGVVRVPELGGHIEGEVRMIRNDIVTNLDDVVASVLEDLLQEQWLKCRLKLLSYVLQQHRTSKPHSILKSPKIVFLTELDHVQTPILLHVLDPIVCLTLRVDHQRPATGLAEDDCILRGLGVRRKACDVPGPHLDRVLKA